MKRDSQPNDYELASNASVILGSISLGFDCKNLPYGYYADPANDCRIFHVCYPIVTGNSVTTRMFSFFCGEGTVFDQVRKSSHFPKKLVFNFDK